MFNCRHTSLSKREVIWVSLNAIYFATSTQQPFLYWYQNKISAVGLFSFCFEFFNINIVINVLEPAKIKFVNTDYLPNLVSNASLS